LISFLCLHNLRFHLKTMPTHNLTYEHMCEKHVCFRTRYFMCFFRKGGAACIWLSLRVAFFKDIIWTTNQRSCHISSISPFKWKQYIFDLRDTVKLLHLFNGLITTATGYAELSPTFILLHSVAGLSVETSQTFSPSTKYNLFCL